MNLRRMRVAAAGAVLVALTTVACTTHAGSAAQVGRSTISASTLRGITDRGAAAASTDATAAQQLDKAALQRKILSLLITGKLLDREASDLGVTVSAQDVDAYEGAAGALEYGSAAALRKQLAAAGLAGPDVALYMRFGALQEAIEDKISPAPAVADATLRQQYEAVVQQFGSLPLSYDTAKPWIVRFLATDARSAALQKRLVAAEKSVKVSVNPRFGAWNAAQLGVVAADGSIATKVAPAPAASSSTTGQ